MRPNRVIPVPVKLAALQIHSLHLLVRYLTARRVFSAIQAASYFQALRGGGARNQSHDCLVVAQRFAPPVRGDEREKPMFDLVPLARSRREMANGNGQARLVRELLQFEFPEPQPPTIAAPAVGRDEQVPRLGIQIAAFGPPPATNRRDGERAGVVVGAHVDEPRVALQVVNPVRVRAWDVGTGKVMAVHLQGLFRGQPLLAGIVVVSQQFLLLRVHGDDGRALGQSPLDLCVDMAELRVTVGMILPLFRLAVALQAVALLLENLCDLYVTERVLLAGQLRGQGARALADPAQRRLRIAARFRINQPVQRPHQSGIAGEDLLASRPRPADAPRRQWRSRLDLPHAFGDGFARQATGAADLRDTAMAQRPGFAGSREPTRPLVQEWPEGREFPLEVGEEFHALTSYALPTKYATFIYYRRLSAILWCPQIVSQIAD